MTRVKLFTGAILLVVLAGLGLQVTQKLSGEDRVGVLLTVTTKRLRFEKGVVVVISYKSSDSDWRGPIKHRADPKESNIEPWNRPVSVRRGATVTLTAYQGIANEITCVISVPSMPGVWSEPKTRRSIGTVKCTLVVP
jgi:hypothetical protein